MAKQIGFLIMRAQPLHEGHLQIIEAALQRCNHLVILLGSVNRAVSFLNPWSYQERRARIIKEMSPYLGLEHVTFYPLNDYKYSDPQWLGDVNSIISSEVVRHNAKPVLFGHMKEGNDYLNMFHGGIEYVNLTSTTNLSATEVREYMAENTPEKLPEAALADYKYFKAEAKRFEVYPYKETLNFNCSDALVECDGHIILIRRKAAPGLGSWALPGGFKERKETFLNCAFRELIEEVNLRVPEKVLRGSVVSTRLFDDPNRGQGIPRNTLGVHIKISRDADGSLPRITAGDDALHCEWVKINKAMNDISMHDDHADIISVMLNVQAIPAHLNPRFL